MPDSADIEFTGERVIPGMVEPNLLNEHLARYRFAQYFEQRLARAGSRVLDAGCGSGFGAATFQPTSLVTGIDISADAVDYAKRHYSRLGVAFVQGSCDTLPFADGSFDLIAAFEVIEHLERWREMLQEARRVLHSTGILLVSTPNKAYYTESRGAAGPNPFHVREFDYGEFQTELRVVFEHVQLWTQNHAEAIVFLPPPHSPGDFSLGDFEAAGEKAPETAEFFFAACSTSPIPAPRGFAWSPESGNVLRERERHVALLESELAQKDAWLKESQRDHATLQHNHERLLAELKQHNEWANQLNVELKEAGLDIARLQREIESIHSGYRERLRRDEQELAEAHAGYRERLRQIDQELAETHAGYQERLRQIDRELAETHAGYREHIRQLETEAAIRLDWVHDLETQIARGRDEVARLDRESAERTEWAQRLDAELRQANAARALLAQHLELAAHSKWVRVGRLLHLGPEIGKDGAPE